MSKSFLINMFSCISALPSILSHTNKLAAISINRSVSQETIEVERAKQIGWIQWIMEPIAKVLNPPDKVSYNISVHLFNVLPSSILWKLRRITVCFVSIQCSRLLDKML